MANKTRSYAFPLSHITYSNRRLLSSFQTKAAPLSPALQIDAIVVVLGGVKSYITGLKISFLNIKTNINFVYYT